MGRTAKLQPLNGVRPGGSRRCLAFLPIEKHAAFINAGMSVILFLKGEGFMSHQRKRLTNGGVLWGNAVLGRHFGAVRVSPGAFAREHALKRRLHASSPVGG